MCLSIEVCARVRVRAGARVHAGLRAHAHTPRRRRRRRARPAGSYRLAGTPGDVARDLPGLSRDGRSASFFASSLPRFGLTEPFPASRGLYAHMFVSFRPRASLSCEHMFCPVPSSTLAQGVRGALALARSFLLLEDDDPVDWEVDREDPGGVRAELSWVSTHRAPLRGRRAGRRPGQPPAPAQWCLCPLPARRPARSSRSVFVRQPPLAPPPARAQRAASTTIGSSRVAIDL